MKTSRTTPCRLFETHSSHTTRSHLRISKDSLLTETEILEEPSSSLRPLIFDVHDLARPSLFYTVFHLLSSRNDTLQAESDIVYSEGATRRLVDQLVAEWQSKENPLAFPSRHFHSSLSWAIQEEVEDER